MHVLHVSNSLVAGGSELHLLALCRHLGALGVTQTVAYLHERPVSRTLKDNFEAIGVPAIPAHAEGRYNVTFPLAVSSIVARIGPDILHTHLPRADLAGAFVTL
ncbi:MAG TPA: glycosyltransferase, partial [bacterium]|nr:glycosyltransferase [bacterium]